MQHQTFNSQTNSVPKRVATASPAPFSPAASQHGFMPQQSPPPPSHTPRVDAPQNGNINYSQPYTQGFQSPAPTASATPVPVSTPSMAQNQMQAQMVYAQMQQARQQQQQQQSQQHQRAMMQQQQPMVPGVPMNAMPMNAQGNPNAMGQVPNQMQRAQMQANPSTPQRPQPSAQQFMKNLTEYMIQRGTPITQFPLIAGRAVDLFRFYMIVNRMGGSQRVHAEGKWDQIGGVLGYPPEQYPAISEEVMSVFRQYLAPYEDAWMRNQREQKQKAQQMAMVQQQRQNQMNQMNQMGQMGQMGQVGQMNAVNPNMQTPIPPQRPNSNGPMMQTPTRPQQVPPRPPSQMQNMQNRTPMQNGYGPQPQLQRQSTPLSQPPSTPVRMPIDAASPQGQGIPPNFTAKMAAPASEAGLSMVGTPVAAVDPGKPAAFDPKMRKLDTHGGFNVQVINSLGYELHHNRPLAPLYQELGNIDIHALTMMLRCGIAAEIKVALDTLATVSVEARQSIALESCEDLIEALVDVAEAQVELLGEHAPEGEEQISLMAYEDVLRSCRTERETLQDVSRFGSLEHELERATDKLICATTILRNLSFFESNHNCLASPNVVRFVSGVIERLGTCPLFLRSYTNLLDFMKDIIIYLSNLAHAIILPSEDEALNFLHLILSFAPQPLPQTNRGTIMFTAYSPSIHRYLPPAVDTLAKLLARDDPNRAFYRQIFLSESNSDVPYDLLTRSFALAISPIPDNSKTLVQQSVEARRPILEQGLLAAEILSNICPSSESPLARQWLSSEDGFALSLLRLVCLLSPQQIPIPPPPQTGRRGQQQQHPLVEEHPFRGITHRGMNILRVLSAKTEDVGTLPSGLLPRKESLLGALLTLHIDPVIVKQLCGYAGLDV
jgi:SWI/SNF chromatin-remodeling complex subunit SWI1